jgi:hypothetical protein
MAYEISQAVKITLVAAANLSAKQYTFVKLDNTGKAAACNGATDKPIGILQNAPVAGAEAEIVVSGGSKVVAGGNLDEGNSVGTDASGKAVVLAQGTDTTKYIVGQALSAGAADEIVTVVINAASAARGA